MRSRSNSESPAESRRRPNSKMVLDVALKIPLHGPAVSVGSQAVSGTLGTGSSSGDGMCNDNDNDEGSDDGRGLHLKVTHPFVEGGDVGLRLVHVLDGSDLDLNLDLDLDPDLNLGHGHDCAAILHWNVTTLGQSYIDEIKLFCLSGI